MNSDSSPAIKPQSTWLALLERSRAGPGPPHQTRPAVASSCASVGSKPRGPSTRGLQGQNSQGTKMAPADSPVEGWWGQLSLAQSGTVYQVLSLLLLFIKPCTRKKKNPHDGPEGTRRPCGPQLGCWGEYPWVLGKHVSEVSKVCLLRGKQLQVFTAHCRSREMLTSCTHWASVCSCREWARGSVSPL